MLLTYMVIQVNLPQPCPTLTLIHWQSETSGQESTRLLCFPIQIPKAYYPAALLALFTIFMGFNLCFFIHVAIGYAYSKGNLPFLLFAQDKIQDAESKFGQYISVRGFVLSSTATGFVAPIDSSGQGGMSLGGSTLSSGLPSMPSIPSIPSIPSFSSLTRSVRSLGGDGSGNYVQVPTSHILDEGRPPPPQEKIFLLTSMGYGREDAIAALERSAGDVDAAANDLAGP